VLLADEPTGNLDGENETNVMNHFKKIQDMFDITIVVATHSSASKSYGNRTIVLDLRSSPAGL